MTLRFLSFCSLDCGRNVVHHPDFVNQVAAIYKIAGMTDELKTLPSKIGIKNTT